MTSRLDVNYRSQDKTQELTQSSMENGLRKSKEGPIKSKEKLSIFGRVRKSFDERKKDEGSKIPPTVESKMVSIIEKGAVSEGKRKAEDRREQDEKEKHLVWQKGQTMLDQIGRKGKMQREHTRRQEPWSIYDWKGLLLVFIMFLSQYDYYNQHQLFHLARKGGGIYMLVLAIFLSLVVQLPFLLIYSHLGHYNQAPSLKVFGLYGRAFRFVGLLMVMSTSFSVGIDSTNLGGSLVYNNIFFKNFTDMVSCENDLSYNFPEADVCCVSLYDGIRSSNTLHSPFCWKVSAPKASLIAFDNEDSVFSSHAPYILVIIGIMLIFVLAISLPMIIFMIVIASIGLLGLLLMLFSHLVMFYYGSLSTGMIRLWKLSDLSNFFDHEVLSGVGFLMMYGSSNFTFISLASMEAPRKRLYWAVIFVYLANILLMTFTVLGDFAVWGRLEELSREIDAISSSADLPLSFISYVLPEFFLATSGRVLWLKIYHMGLICLQLARFSCPFFDVMAVYYRNPSWKRTLAATSLVVAIILIPVVVDAISIHESTKISEGILCMLNIVLIVLSLLVAFVIYGPDQHIFDVVTYYPLSGRWYDMIGPTSPAFSFVFTQLATPFLLIMMMVGIVKTGEDFEEIASLGGYQNLAKLAYLLLIIPMAVFVFCLVYDVFLPMSRQETSSWKLFYPQKGHPGYKRLVAIWKKPKHFSESSSSEDSSQSSKASDRQSDQLSQFASDLETTKQSNLETTKKSDLETNRKSDTMTTKKSDLETTKQSDLETKKKPNKRITKPSNKVSEIPKKSDSEGNKLTDRTSQGKEKKGGKTKKKPPVQNK